MPRIDKTKLKKKLIDKSNYLAYSNSYRLKNTYDLICEEYEKLENIIIDKGKEIDVYKMGKNGDTLNDSKLEIVISKIEDEISDAETRKVFLAYKEFTIEYLVSFKSAVRKLKFPIESKKLRIHPKDLKYLGFVSGKEKQGIKIFNEKKIRSIIFDKQDDYKLIPLRVRTLDQTPWGEYLQAFDEELGIDSEDTFSKAISITKTHLQSKNLVIIIKDFKEIEKSAYRRISEFLELLISNLKNHSWNKSLFIIIYNDLDTVNITYDNITGLVKTFDSDFTVGGFDKISQIELNHLKDAIEGDNVQELVDLYTSITDLKSENKYLKPMIDSIQRWAKEEHPCHEFSKCIYKDLAEIN